MSEKEYTEEERAAMAAKKASREQSEEEKAKVAAKYNELNEELAKLNQQRIDILNKAREVTKERDALGYQP